MRATQTNVTAKVLAPFILLVLSLGKTANAQQTIFLEAGDQAVMMTALVPVSSEKSFVKIVSTRRIRPITSTRS